MRTGWRSRQVREPRDRSAAAGGGEVGAPSRKPHSPYSDQYETLIAQGHTRPAPPFGAPAPAPVWHTATGPRRTVEGSGEALLQVQSLFQ